MNQCSEISASKPQAELVLPKVEEKSASPCPAWTSIKDWCLNPDTY